MTTIRQLLHAAAILAASQVLSAAVPSTINYQGRLTNVSGIPQPGTHAMSLKIYDAASAGTQLYAETLGSVTVDANGVYSFQFGAGGNSNTLVTETIATTDGTALTYQKALTNTLVIAGTASVTDGTYSWNETTGNPGSPATATATVTAGFVIGATVTNGSSGYTAAPVVTITGNGSGAAATATVSSGAVTAINIASAGSGYTAGASITIAPPPAPFIVNYSGGTITATYASAPAAGQTITATYRYSAGGISGALANGAEQWLELTIDGVVQTPRQKVLAVPFAVNAKSADVAKTLEDQERIWRADPVLLGYSGSYVTSSILSIPADSISSYQYSQTRCVLPITFKKIKNIHLIYYNYGGSVTDANGFHSVAGIFGMRILKAKYGFTDAVVWEKTITDKTRQHDEVIVTDISLDPSFIYRMEFKISSSDSSAREQYRHIDDILFTVLE